MMVVQGGGGVGCWFPWGQIKTYPRYQRGGVWEEQEPWVEPASVPLNSESVQSSVWAPPGFQTWSCQVTGWGKAFQAQGPASIKAWKGMNWAGSSGSRPSGWRGKKERVKYPYPASSSRTSKKPSRPKGAGKSYSHYILMLQRLSEESISLW